MTKEEITNTEQYQRILSVFEDIINLSEGNENDIQYIISVLAVARFERLFWIVADGLMLTYEYAIEILKGNIDKHRDDIDEHNALVLISAMENLLKFSVCQEYQMMNDIQDIIDSKDTLSDLDIDKINELFFKYNGLWAHIEDNTVMQSATMAYMWGNLRNNSIMQFTTQRDERVRYSHSALDGFKAPKDDFPAELIPPIDYNCRCYLVNAGSKDFDVDDTYYENRRELIKEVNGVFAGSLAKYGNIFGDSHPYFDIKESDYDNIDMIIQGIENIILSKD